MLRLNTLVYVSMWVIVMGGLFFEFACQESQQVIDEPRTSYYINPSNSTCSSDMQSSNSSNGVTTVVSVLESQHIRHIMLNDSSLFFVLNVQAPSLSHLYEIDKLSGVKTTLISSIDNISYISSFQIGNEKIYLSSFYFVASQQYCMISSIDRSSGIHTPLVTSSSYVPASYMILDDNMLYWLGPPIDGTMSCIFSYNSSNSNIDSLCNVNNQYFLQSDVNYLYGISDADIIKVDKTSGSVEPLTTTVSGGSLGYLTEDSNNLYWTEGNNVNTMNKTGGAVQEIANHSNIDQRPHKLFRYDQYLYWNTSTTIVPSNEEYHIFRLKLDGTSSIEDMINTTSSNEAIFDFAVDADYLYWITNAAIKKMPVTHD